MPPNPKLVVLKIQKNQYNSFKTSCTTYFVCPNVGAELGVAKVFVACPKAGGADVAGVVKPKEKAESVMNCQLAESLGRSATTLQSAALIGLNRFDGISCNFHLINNVLVSKCEVRLQKAESSCKARPEKVEVKLPRTC